MSLPLAYWLAYSQWRIVSLVETLVSMPLVLPPSVLGYYVLVAFSPRNGFGKWVLETFDVRLAFTFEGILIASVLFGLPFMVQPLQNGLRSLPATLREASYTLGKSKFATFTRVLLPSIKPSVVTALALSFAHCIGEFGIVLMVGGNMPGETRVASIAIYDEVQAMNLGTANRYAFILFMVSFLLLIVIYSTRKHVSAWKSN
ncbi:MAG: molybdate ABC transporter permease subunit [Breznakibacter sp.]